MMNKANNEFFSIQGREELPGGRMKRNARVRLVTRALVGIFPNCTDKG
jgi:hypothetical protein